MRENQKTHPPVGQVTEKKFVDFSFNSDDGLGALSRFPKEIRNIIYGFVVPLVTASTQDEDDPTIDDGLVRALMAFPLLEASKQLCVEFLEIYIRSIKLEETTRLDYSSSRLTDHSLEALLAYVGMRIHAIPHPTQLGFRIAPPFFNMWVYTAELKDDVAHLLPRQVKRLWTFHEKYGVTSDKLYIKMTYSEPAELIASLASTSMTIRSSTLTHLFHTNYWLHKFDIITAKISISNRSASTQAMNDMVSSAGAQINEYRVSKMRDLQRNCTPAESIVLESVLNDEVAPFWDQRCVPRLVRLHATVIDTATELWVAMEEQYNVHHLFDLAESWLDLD
ncbi:hypothetical protein D6C85_08475 [Aureobasidium pullulans]|uniref:Uncharacterized protein n=1 Tax=Aureobasidium pullulans TaxID=5580 RepID=A0A4S9WI03_AURPU|nr:hypothetical protein D6C85_08475 [Aureobasidium pullulans]